MKNFFMISCAVLLVLSGGCTHKPVKSDFPLQVMTFNVRLDTSSDGLNGWPYRRDNIGQMLSYYAPDLLGMQEVLPNQMQDLQMMLPQYTSLGVGREDGRNKGEYSPIFFRTERFELLRSGNFSLSQTPDSFGILGWDAACARVCTWALLRDLYSGHEVAYFNTHLDHIGTTARREGMRLILDSLKNIANGLPVIVTGDFNCPPYDEPAQILESGGLLNAWTSASVTYGPSWSFHDFGRKPVAERLLLDYVFTTPQLAAQRCRIIQDTPDNGYYSDHCPVIAELTYESPK